MRKVILHMTFTFAFNETRSKQSPGGRSGRALSPASAAAQRKDVMIMMKQTAKIIPLPCPQTAAAPPRRSRIAPLAWLETIVTAAIGVCSIVGLTAFLILCF